MEFVIICLIGFILGMLYSGSGKDKLDTQIMSYLKAGKRVIVCVDDNATIFEMVGNRIRVSKALTTFMEEPDGVEPNSVDDSGISESGNYNETGVAD
jgi:hypothetical protein